MNDFQMSFLEPAERIGRSERAGEWAAKISGLIGEIADLKGGDNFVLTVPNRPVDNSEK